MEAVAIQIISGDSQGLSLSRDDQIQLKDEVSDLLKLHWLPPVSKDRKAYEAGFEVTTVILIFALATVLSSTIKPFVEEVSKEAGKDFWKGIKKLIAKIWKKQVDNTYRLSSKAYIIFEYKEEHIGICFRISGITPNEVNIAAFEKKIDESIAGIIASWDEIQKTLGSSDIGQLNNSEGERRIHIIAGADDYWRIYTESNWEFFNRDQQNL